MKINIYRSEYPKEEFLACINVRNIFEKTIFRCPMPTIGAKTCKKILGDKKHLYCLFEDVKTGKKCYQMLFSCGTIINF